MLIANKVQRKIQCEIFWTGNLIEQHNDEIKKKFRINYIQLKKMEFDLLEKNYKNISFQRVVFPIVTVCSQSNTTEFSFSKAWVYYNYSGDCKNGKSDGQGTC